MPLDHRPRLFKYRMENTARVRGDAPAKEGASTRDNEGRHQERGQVRIKGLRPGCLDLAPSGIIAPLFALASVVATEPRKPFRALDPQIWRSPKSFCPTVFDGRSVPKS